jgi:hypothetical protein
MPTSSAVSTRALRTVEEESWPVARSADELHDALLTLVLVPPAEEWKPFFEELRREGRAGAFRRGEKTFWVAAERLAWAETLLPDGSSKGASLPFPGSLREAPRRQPRPVHGEHRSGRHVTSGKEAADLPSTEDSGRAPARNGMEWLGGLDPRTHST